jgi:hypothetical protein
MALDIHVCKTCDVSDQRWSGFVKSFNEVFSENSTVEQKKQFYSNNIYGFSYHAFVIDNEKVVGHTSLIPSNYINGDELFLAGISGGTFVCEEYRKDIFLFKKMYNRLTDYASKDGLIATLGVPNENSFAYATKILKKEYIGDLNFYALPIKLGNILYKGKKKWLNVLSYTFAHLWVVFNRLSTKIWNNKEEPVKFKLDISDDFLDKRFSKEYRTIKSGRFRFDYKLVDEEGISVAYLMFATERGDMTSAALCLSVDFILKECKPDLILYVGLLNLTQSLLIKVPKSKKPKRLPLTLDLINKEKNLNGYLDIKNWKFGLIDFDVR